MCRGDDGPKGVIMLTESSAFDSPLRYSSFLVGCMYLKSTCFFEGYSKK